LTIENNKLTSTTKNINIMKTTIATIAILIITVFGFSKVTYAASNNEEASTLLTNFGRINQIEVHGNVELYVSDGNEDQVKVYNKYYAESALVQDQDGVLRISSYTAQKLKVWVTVSQLSKLSVYDNATVKSFGKISAIDLNVQLFNTASAKLELDTFAANITLNDHAKADITGSIDEAGFKYDQSAFLNTAMLSALHMEKNVNLPVSGGADEADITLF
jgi:hypothetical protein